MAINTSGYSVGVLPQYSPVDANLAAFNPAAAIQGAAQGIDMVTGLQKLKDMRQIHEENAKMSAAKNKLLQAQADEAALLRDHEQAIADSKLAAALAKNKEDALNAPKEGESKRAGYAASIKTNENVGLAADAARPNIGRVVDLNMQMLQDQATSASVALDSARRAYEQAPQSTELARELQRANILESESKYKLAIAQAGQATAQTAYIGDKSAIERDKIAARNQMVSNYMKHEESLRKQLDDVNTTIARIEEKTLVPDPNDKRKQISLPTLMSQLAVNREGKLIARSTGRIWDSTAGVPETTLAIVNKYRDQVSRSEQLTAQIENVSNITNAALIARDEGEANAAGAPSTAPAGAKSSASSASAVRPIKINVNGQPLSASYTPPASQPAENPSDWTVEQLSLGAAGAAGAVAAGSKLMPPPVSTAKAIGSGAQWAGKHLLNLASKVGPLAGAATGVGAVELADRYLGGKMSAAAGTDNMRMTMAIADALSQPSFKELSEGAKFDQIMQQIRLVRDSVNEGRVSEEDASNALTVLHNNLRNINLNPLEDAQPILGGNYQFGNVNYAKPSGPDLSAYQ